MTWLKKAAIIAELTEKLSGKGSWCGETHLQKAMYFLQELCRVPTEFDFILYKHGPFSFDFRDALTEMRADGLLRLISQYPYGPSLATTDTAKELRTRFPSTIKNYSKHIDFVAATLGNKRVNDLEQLATALWVYKEMPGYKQRELAQRIHELKPHVSLEDAQSALEAVQQIRIAA